MRHSVSQHLGQPIASLKTTNKRHAQLVLLVPAPRQTSAFGSGRWAEQIRPSGRLVVRRGCLRRWVPNRW